MPSPRLVLALIATTSLAAAPRAGAQERDADAPPRLTITPEDVRRLWMLVLEQWGIATDSDLVARWYADAGFTPRVLPGPGWVALVAGQKT